MNINTINVYSEEFVLFLDEQKIDLDTEFKEIESILNYVNSDPLITEFIKAPVVDFQKKFSLLSELTEDKNILNLFSVLEKNGKIEFFVDILKQTLKLINKKNGITDVTVTSAVNLDQNQIEKVGKLVKKIFNLDSKITNNIDQSVIGGVVIQVNNDILDLSLRKQFESMSNIIADSLSEN
jgi:F-type H+-transporting ATPase subunit delta